MLPDKEVTESTVTSLQAQRATLRQRTLFEYGLSRKVHSTKEAYRKIELISRNPYNTRCHGEIML